MSKKFPLFIDLESKKIVVVGAGTIALRRISVLLNYTDNIIVIAPYTKNKELLKKVSFFERPFCDSDTEGAFFVIAATNDRVVNRRVYELCIKDNIYVSVADKKEECTFFFPAVCLNDTLSIGIVSDGNHHKSVKNIAQRIRGVINE